MSISEGPYLHLRVENVSESSIKTRTSGALARNPRKSGTASASERYAFSAGVSTERITHDNVRHRALRVTTDRSTLFDSHLDRTLQHETVPLTPFPSRDTHDSFLSGRVDTAPNGITFCSDRGATRVSHEDTTANRQFRLGRRGPSFLACDPQKDEERHDRLSCTNNKIKKRHKARRKHLSLENRIDDDTACNRARAYLDLPSDLPKQIRRRAPHRIRHNDNDDKKAPPLPS